MPKEKPKKITIKKKPRKKTPAKRGQKKQKEKPEKKPEKRLTLKEKQFCLKWFDLDGNGTKAALHVYDIENKELYGRAGLSKAQQIVLNKALNTAAVIAGENLRKPHIIKEIDRLMGIIGLTDETVKREHFHLISQQDDLKSKARGIEMYYKVTKKMPSEIKVALTGEAAESAKEFLD